MSKPLLKVELVSKHFGGIVAVNNVSFSLNEGEKVGLIGPNGAGKTTLFNIITGFARADSGRVVLDGRDIRTKSTAAIVNFGIARTFQIVRPFSKISVFDNVLIPALCPHARKNGKGMSPSEIASDSLDRVGLLGKKDLLAADLTHAELKRLEMARAMATKPRLLLLDEPYGGLGSNEVGPASELIRSLGESGVTLLLIEHRLRELMRNVERVIAMDQGTIVIQGTPDEVVSDARVIQAYLGTSKGPGDSFAKRG
jgi:branched-chain amino acid transport system ATP-binding protein